MESASSANAGSRVLRGKSEDCVLALKLWLSRRDVRELERRGVVGREEGLMRVADVDLLVVLLSIFGLQIDK